MTEPTPPPPAPTVTLTLRLTPEDLAELDTLTAELAFCLPRLRFGGRVSRSTVAAEAMRAGLDALRREHDIPTDEEIAAIMAKR